MSINLPIMHATLEGDRIVRGNFELEVAYNEEDCRQGLMFRQYLEEGRGMLLRNPVKGVMSIWMKNTTISLDLVFLGPDWRVTTLFENVHPLSEQAHISSGEAIAAIEFTAGTIRNRGVMVGDALYRSKAIAL